MILVDPEKIAALRALRDCGVVRASRDHPGYRALRRHQLVSYSAAAGGLWDYRLNRWGEAIAKETFGC